jgi:hypothetical protein
MLGKPVRKLDTGPHADRVVVASGEQRRPGRRAQRGDVEVGELQAAGGEGVDVRGVDVGAVAAELGEAGVVEQDDHHVGRVGAGVRRLVEFHDHYVPLRRGSDPRRNGRRHEEEPCPTH